MNETNDIEPLPPCHRCESENLRALTSLGSKGSRHAIECGCCGFRIPFLWDYEAAETRWRTEWRGRLPKGRMSHLDRARSAYSLGVARRGLEEIKKRTEIKNSTAVKIVDLAMTAARKGEKTAKIFSKEACREDLISWISEQGFDPDPISTVENGYTMIEYGGWADEG